MGCENSSNFNKDNQINDYDMVLPYIPYKCISKDDLTGKYISKVEKFKHLVKNDGYLVMLTK